MNKKRGFTLVELLVVISIIALLMAILMPALAKVKNSAKEAACQMNQKQIGLAFSMYTSDNNGFFTDGALTGGVGGIGDWLGALDGGYKYETPKTIQQIEDTRDSHRTLSYIKDYGIIACAMATRAGTDTPYKYRAYNDRLGIRSPGADPTNANMPYAPEGTVGSYAHNAWCNNAPTDRWGYQVRYCWRTTAIAGAGEVPVTADSSRWGCNPQATNTPPAYDGDGGGGTYNEFPRVILDRHNGAIDILFMDWSVRRVRLTDLYKLKWHRNWTNELETAGGEPDWPDWMRNF